MIEPTAERILPFPLFIAGPYCVFWNGDVWQSGLPDFQSAVESLRVLRGTEGREVGVIGQKFDWLGSTGLDTIKANKGDKNASAVQGKVHL